MSATGNKITAGNPDIFDPSFSQKDQAHSVLLCIIDGSMFSAAAYDTEQGACRGIQTHFLDAKGAATQKLIGQIRQLWDEEDHFSFDYSKIRVAMVREPLTVVPESFNASLSPKEWISVTNRVENNEIVRQENVPGYQMTCFYRIPQALSRYFEEQSKNSSMTHAGRVWLQGLSQTCQPDQEQVFAQVWSDTVFITVLHKKDCLFFNTFHYKTAKDFLYYVLAVYDQLELNPESVPLTLYGEVQKSGAIYRKAHQYIRDLEFGKKPDSLSMASALSETPAHYYFNLLCLQLCE